MIVFRVGSDDAEFLEKEFDPEFTPQDIVNLPNYKIYIKLMIDGVTSRPFSAKTLPPMVKSGNREIEEEVIKSSRALYCRPREVVEREIYEWSGMSLGSDTDTGSGALEKFPVICSLCKKETTVPFKPEPGRAVYCKGKEKVTPEEAREYLAANNLQIKEVEKGPGSGLKIVPSEEAPGEFDVVDPSGRIRFSGRTQEDARTYINEEEELGHGSTKFGSYQLPGGQNYRELSFTLPGFSPELDQFEEPHWGKKLR